MSQRNRPKFGLALGSGGARGWSHIGVLRTLHDNGLAPDIVCGSSMGALVGAAYVSGALDRLETFARGLTRISATRLVDFYPATGGLIEGGLIVEKLRQLGFKPDFGQLTVPFLAVASDLATGTEVWLRKGDLVEAVRASIGIPGIFSPVFLEDSWLLDGGMTNPVPVSACRALGADVVVAVDPNSKMYAFRHRQRNAVPETAGFDRAALLELAPEPLRNFLGSAFSPPPAGPRPPGYFSVLSASIDLMTDQIRRVRMAGDPPHLIVSPDLTDFSILDFHRAAGAIEEGRRAMTRQLDALRDLLGH